MKFRLRRIEEAEGRWILLAASLIAVIANRFETEHRDNPFAALPAFARVDEAAHLRSAVEWRLFVDEGDEADRSLRPGAGKSPRQSKHGRDAAAVVVRCRTAWHGIVVGSDDDNLLRTGPAGNLDFQIVADLATNLEAEPADIIACFRERGLDPRSRLDQARIHEHIAIADFVRNHADVALERVTQRVLLRTQWQPRSAIAFKWHPKHKAPAAEAERR